MNFVEINLYYNKFNSNISLTKIYSIHIKEILDFDRMNWVKWRFWILNLISF